MNGIEDTSQDIISKTRGGGCLMLFGLPFFLAGIFIVLAALEVVPAKMDADQPRIVLVLFGLVFASVGFVIMFGRTGITIDKQANTLRKWSGILGPMKIREYSLDQYDRIVINRKTRSSGKSGSSSTVYPVRLEGPGTSQNIDFDVSHDYQAARQSGEHLAKYLNLIIEDQTSGKTVIRDPGTLDDSVREKMRRTGEISGTLSMPYGMRSQVREEFGRVTVDIPPAGFTKIHLIYILPGVIFSLAIWFFFLSGFREMDAPAILHYIFTGFIIVFFIALPILLTLVKTLKQAYRSWQITATPEMFHMEEKSLWSSRKFEIPGDELEELDLIDKASLLQTATSQISQHKPRTTQEELRMRRMLDPNSFFGRIISTFAKGHIVARSDRVTVKFGEGLSPEELRYLHAVIRKTMAA